MEARIECPVTVHGIRHSFHDLARQQGVPDAVVKAMAGRVGAKVAQRGQDKHLHYSRGVTVEEMRQAAMALMQLVPSVPVAGPKSRDRSGDGSGRDRESDDELAVTTGPWPPGGVIFVQCPAGNRMTSDREKVTSRGVVAIWEPRDRVKPPAGAMDR